MRLGPYEILSPVGKGGMGEVYRARDTKLDRLVAIKVLPEEFAADEERLARFEREAKLLASLNHPNIATLYGLVEHEGRSLLVMELVEGKTLDEVGTLPLDEALPLYIENSPVFHARHIETPLLIQFGDIDEAVPWQQGIELYLAMRRLDKDVIFLQYRGEPHHLKKYPNKLDYSIKMMEYFDHYLKGAEAPAWITEGVPYRGE